MARRLELLTVAALENDEYRLTTRVENEVETIVIHGTATVVVDDLPEAAERS